MDYFVNVYNENYEPIAHYEFYDIHYALIFIKSLILDNPYIKCNLKEYNIKTNEEYEIFEYNDINDLKILKRVIFNIDEYINYKPIKKRI